MELDDRRGQNRRAEGFTPATQPVITDDLDQQRTAPFVPGLRIANGSTTSSPWPAASR